MRPEQERIADHATGVLPYTHIIRDSGVPDAELSALVARLHGTFHDYAAAPPPEARAIFHLADADYPLEEIHALTDAWKARFRTMIVVGSGGSGLSGKALALLACGRNKTRLPRMLHVLDNLDPVALLGLLNTTELNTTCFLIVSKSGRTVETFALTAAIIETLKSEGITDFSARMALITAPAPSPLRTLAEQHGMRVLDHAPDLCGRFSILSAVGLIPAAFVDLDIAQMGKGAACALSHNLRHATPETSPAAFGAAMLAAQARHRRNVAVFMPYTERLWGLALWWRQSWAESLGKDGMGSTPLAFLGPADQHSQLQLCLDGPDDKCFTLVLPALSRCGTQLPPVEGTLSYLSGHTLGDLVEAQARATLETLLLHRRPLRVLQIGEPDEFTLGALLMHCMLEICFAGALMGVNPFDQPAVEESKRLAHLYLTEKKRAP